MSYPTLTPSTYTYPTMATDVLLKEDGDPLLTEDGNEILLENPRQDANYPTSPVTSFTYPSNP